jgi:hypothetical protein
MTRFGPLSESQAASLNTRQRSELLTVLRETVYRIPDGHSPGNPSYGGLHGNAVNGLERRGLIYADLGELFSLTEDGHLVLGELRKSDPPRPWQ